MFRALCLNFSLLILPGIARAQAAAATPPAAPVEAPLFAPDDMAGQVLALTVDDAGRVFSATTKRAFGRGTVTAGKHAAMRQEDQALRSMEQRARLLQAWLAGEKLDPLLKERASFFDQSGDGPQNFLTKYSESIKWLADPDRDGIANTSDIVAESFGDPLDGPGSALLALSGGRWIFGCTPHLWRLLDRNDDQRAEERTPLAEGFGLASDPWGADLHALLEAPDGWIYFAVGSRGYQVTTADGNRVRGMGSGAIFRCHADGSGLVRIASGLRNPTGLAMLPDGRLMAMDEAALGGKSRLLHVIPGADFGWQESAVTEPGKGLWFEENMEHLQAGDLPSPDKPQWCLPAVASLDLEASALTALPDGTLLAADQQAEGKGGLILLTPEPPDTPSGLVQWKPQDLWRGGAVMALTSDAEGTLYFADWGAAVDAWSRCQVRRLPRPFKMDPPPAPDRATRLILKDLPNLPVRDLKQLLEDPSPRVQLRARQRLEGMSFQDSLEALLQMARRSPSLPARLHGLQGAAAVARQDPALLSELHAFLSDPLPEIRATTATLLGEGPAQAAPPPLHKALSDNALTVRAAAARALARLRPEGLLPELLTTAAGHPQRDPFLRSALAEAMSSAVPAVLLAESGLTHPSPEARLTAVHALRRLGAMELGAFLTDSDPTVATEAARAIYDLPLRPAFPALLALLEQPDPRPLATARRAMTAAWMIGTPAAANQLVQFATTSSRPQVQVLMALDLLEKWDLVETPDPLWNRPSRALPRLPGQALPALRRLIAFLQNHPDPTLTAKAKSAATKAGPVRRSDELLAAIRNNTLDLPSRLAAWQNMAADCSPETARSLLHPDIPPPIRAEARALLMRRDPKAGHTLALEALASGSVIEKQTALRTLDRLPGTANENERLILELTRQLGTGIVDRQVQVELLESLQRRDIESRSPWRKSTDAWMASLTLNTDPLAGWRMTVDGGDPIAGQLLFETHTEARCLTCHSLEGQGGLTGPDLDGVSGRLTPNGLLESLIHPGAKFAKGHSPPPASANLPAGDDSNATNAHSPMPPMGTILTLRELRDLMAFLRTLTDPTTGP